MADFNEYKGVWVFCEQRQGALMSTDFELVSEARKLADELGCEVTGLLLGDNVEGIAKELGGNIVALQHGACALLRRSEGLKDVRRRTLQANGVHLDQRIVLQCVVVEHFHGLIIAGKDTVHAHVAGVVQLLDAGQQAGSLHLDHHVAVLQHTLQVRVLPSFWMSAT